MGHRDGRALIRAGLGGCGKEVIDAIPVALMRPFSAGGSRGFMLDAMKTYGADSLTGQLSLPFPRRGGDHLLCGRALLRKR
jgi:spore maturation protein SpmB